MEAGCFRFAVSAARISIGKKFMETLIQKPFGTVFSRLGIAVGRMNQRFLRK